MLLSKQICKKLLLSAAVCFLSFSDGVPVSAQQVHIIPKPAEMQVKDGFFKVNKSTVVVLPDKLPSSELLHDMMDHAVAGSKGGTLKIARHDVKKNAIRFVLDKTNPDKATESYSLEVDGKGVTITSGSDKGLFYGAQTLLQLMSKDGIAFASIKDEPRFPYRGYHLDVSRNFFPKEFIIKMLDWMAFYKLNTFHWHLTDGAGWRIEIDAYPKLTSDAAFRPIADWKTWWDGDRKFVPEGTPGAYGGYYTKKEVREVVAYAASKHITVIPEIEMPGHSEEVFVAYPELSCSGIPYKNSDFCIGNDSTFTFVEQVLTEVMELFPSRLIHIGGDEASKKAWGECPKCQQRMKNEGLSDLDELQSYMIRRVEKFLNSKGRRLVGWDEIIEGGLAPEATVMSWRGVEGGIKAAKDGHDVIMTPGNYMYFDFYQADPKTQPAAIGGFTPVKQVYSYNPMPAELNETEGKHILGVQANTWTEYMPNADHVEYMVFPRLLALAEVAWTPQELRTWADFKPRMNSHVNLLKKGGVNAFTLSDDIEITMAVDTLNRQIKVMFDAEKYPAEIRYTTDGSMPTTASAMYKDTILVKDSAWIKAAIFRNGVMQGTPSEKKVDYHKGINRPIHYNSKLYKGYMAGGMNALLDGYRGGLTYLDGRWQGYLNDLDCVVDMGEKTDLHKVSVRFMQLTGPGVFQPGEVSLLTSEDGVNFTLQQTIKTVVPKEESNLTFQEYTFQGNWKGRFVRLQASEVNNGFIFADEIVIW